MQLSPSSQNRAATRIANRIHLNTIGYGAATGAPVSYPTHREDAGRITHSFLPMERA